MSTAAKRVPLPHALGMVDHLQRLLAPACERLEVVGSLRRRCVDVGDIELLIKPAYDMEQKPGELFLTLERVDLFERRLTALREQELLVDHPTRPADGPKYKRLWSPTWELAVDLFIVDRAASWGPAMAIRTGPADFSRLLVTKLRQRGLRCHELQVLKEDGTSIPCATEEQFFQLCGVPYIAPADRGQR